MMKERIPWLDAVRFIAIFLLICCHSADPFNYFPGEQPANMNEFLTWGAIWGCMMRPCVPLFVMLTGALLLPVAEDSKSFYKKRILRVFWPFLIWTVLYALFPFILGCFGASPSTVLNLFPGSGQDAANLSFGGVLRRLAMLPVNFNQMAVHMWYIYMLIGLYLYLPVFSAWVEKASEKEKGWFLAIWGVTLLIPYLTKYIYPAFWGVCDWNPFGMLYYFAGFNGYLLLGHFLRNHILPVRKAVPLSIVLFIAGYAVTYLGFCHIRALPHADSDLELFWYYNSPQVVAMTMAIFILVASIGSSRKTHNDRLVSLGSSLTRCGFGIYMIHFMLTGTAVQMLRVIGIPVPLQIPCAGVVVLAVSWGITALIKKIPGKFPRILLG